MLPTLPAPAVRRVLVVDDEPHIRAVLRGYLEADGLAVSEAADGEEAVRQVRQNAPDLVLLDVMLPGIDGLEALRQVRTFSDVYVILVTARAEEVDKLVGLGVGADDYVTRVHPARVLAATGTPMHSEPVHETHPHMPLMIRDAVSVPPVVGRVTGPSWPVMRGQDGFHADVWSQTGSALGSRTTTAGSRTTTAVCVDR